VCPISELLATPKFDEWYLCHTELSDGVQEGCLEDHAESQETSDNDQRSNITQFVVTPVVSEFLHTKKKMLRRSYPCSFKTVHAHAVALVVGLMGAVYYLFIAGYVLESEVTPEGIIGTVIFHIFFLLASWSYFLTVFSSPGYAETDFAIEDSEILDQTEV
jgi:hypothetical protein